MVGGKDKEKKSSPFLRQSHDKLGHREMECPSYEYCRWCRQHGSYRFIGGHKCQIIEQDDPMSSGWDDRDADLWADNN